MSTVVVEKDYHLQLPEEVRQAVPVGARLHVSLDQAGRIILTPAPDIQTILQETFGMWADREDLPADGVEYVNDIRPGRRLDDLGLGADETA